MTLELAPAISRAGNYRLLPPLCFPLGTSRGQTQFRTLSALTTSGPAGKALADKKDWTQKFSISRGTWLAPSVEFGILDLGVVSSSPMLEVEPT